MLNFAVPSAIFLAALALPIIAFYILKVRMRRINVSTNLFWKQIFEEKPPRSIWQNFRHWLSLLLQLFLLASLVLAFADPYFPWQILQARRIVLVIDPSASMKATDVAPTRFEAAKAAGKSILEGLRFRDQLAIVLSGTTPEVVIGMTSHVPTLQRALNGVKVTDNPTSLTTAVELGKQLIGTHPHGQVIVLTDACEPSLRIEKSQSAAVSMVSEEGVSEVQYRVFGTEAANVGIHQFQVRRSLTDPIGYEVLAGIFNASNAPIKCRLELSLNDSIVDVIPVDLGANEKWSRAIEKTSLKGGRLHAELTRIRSDDTDAKDSSGKESESAAKLNALNSDDNAWAILPARAIQKVLIVTSGNIFLTKVFEANPLVQVSVVNELPTEWPTDGLIVFHRMVPEKIPYGNVFVVDPTNGCDLWDMGGAIDNPIVTEIDKTSPLMHHVRLDNVVMSHANQLQFKGATRTLAGTLDKYSVYADVRKTDGKCLVLSVDLEQSDLAFRTVFPIIVANALGWFAGTSGELVESQTTGSSLNIEIDTPKLNPDNTMLQLRSASGVIRPLKLTPNAPSAEDSSEASTAAKVSMSAEQMSAPGPRTERWVNAGPFFEAGIWEITADEMSSSSTDQKLSLRQSTTAAQESSPVLAEVAVNIADPLETDLRPEQRFLDSTATSILSSGWFSRPLWFYLVALASFLIAAEWFLYQRRIIT